MKKLILPILICLIATKGYAQDPDPNSNIDQRVITTGVPFMLIAADARSAGMADMGVWTSSDAFAQQWNPAKYAFAISKQGIGVTYTPYLSKLV